jgi:hypothetical protein
LHRSHPRKIARGAALPLALILLGVLTVVAVAAVQLSSQERQNAVSYSRLDAVYACANAATAKLWSEIAVSGTTLGGATQLVSSITLSDGTKLTAPAHYDTTTGGVTVGQMVASSASSASSAPETSMENKGVPTVAPGQTYSFTVTCQDANGRAFEIELGLKFAL